MYTFIIIINIIILYSYHVPVVACVSVATPLRSTRLNKILLNHRRSRVVTIQYEYYYYLQ